MQYLNSLIKSETTNELYSHWEKYRNSLTEFIISSIKDSLLESLLTEKKIKRLDREYDIEELLADARPSLAIWGAGGCNDIDVLRLSKYFKLVLIDRDMGLLKEAVSRFNLSQKDVTLLDLHFWEVTDDDYHLFEALLLDKCSIEEFLIFFKDIVNKQTKIATDISFDYSVAVGLASQLVSRFTALAYLHFGRESERYHRLNEELNILAVSAVQCFFDGICNTTEKLVIHGFEVRSCTSCHDAEIEYAGIIDCIDKEDVMNIAYTIKSDVTGNDYLIECIKNKLESDQTYINTSIEYLIWDFLPEKKYIMELVAINA